ncbi:capsular polysaccharide biosynthesis protein [Listeria fleischmannii 1991]|nr:CpsD/CapB family tyrosine-protein kinase [Listeria fleischmannii]KMT59154.1 capsular polysaccharide biosynthesis protein [Listeria fleischmannii 1991]
MSEQITRGRNLITIVNPNGPISEQFKTLRTGIHFSSVDTKYQSIMITSPEPNNGKSTISANLAVCYAKQGNRTLLIDADMRKPTVHRTFDIRVNVGLSNLLTGDMERSEVFRQTEIDNLVVLTSGTVPPNPNELLISKKMEKLMQQFSQEFDQIIIDTPPILASSDALVLTPYVDGTVVVLRSEKSLKDRTKIAVDQLRKTNVPIIGTVLNCVKNRLDNYYDYS